MPTEGMDSSSAQRPLSQRTRSLLTMSDQLLQPTVVPNVSQKLKEQKNKQAVYHDREGKRKIKKKTLLLSKFWLFKVIAIFDKISKTIEQ